MLASGACLPLEGPQSLAAARSVPLGRPLDRIGQRSAPEAHVPAKIVPPSAGGLRRSRLEIAPLRPLRRRAFLHAGRAATQGVRRCAQVDVLPPARAVARLPGVSTRAEASRTGLGPPGHVRESRDDADSDGRSQRADRSDLVLPLQSSFVPAGPAWVRPPGIRFEDRRLPSTSCW